MSASSFSELAIITGISSVYDTYDGLSAIVRNLGPSEKNLLVYLVENPGTLSDLKESGVVKTPRVFRKSFRKLKDNSFIKESGGEIYPSVKAIKISRYLKAGPSEKRKSPPVKITEILTDRRMEILNVINKNPGIITPKIAKEIDYKDSYIHKHLEILGYGKFIRIEGFHPKSYYPTPKGILVCKNNSK